MALILRGKNRGLQFGVSQWANDWVSLDNGQVVRPDYLQLDLNEMALFKKMENAEHCGFFYKYYYVNEEGHIKKRP